MRAFMTIAALTITVLTMNENVADAHPTRDAALVDGWYHRYFGRHGDPVGIGDHVRALHSGTPVDVVEASVLSSHEYWHRAGCTPEGYVAALFRDVLGRRAYPDEMARYVYRVQVQGRQTVALQIVNQRNFELVRPIVVQSAPVIVPTVVVPAHRHHSHAVIDAYPRPAVSIRLNFGR